MNSSISIGCKRLLAHSLEKLFFSMADICVVTRDESDIKVLNNALNNIGLNECHLMFSKTHSALLSEKIFNNLCRITEFFSFDDDYLCDLLLNSKPTKPMEERHPCNPSFIITQSLLCTLALLYSKNELSLLRSLSISDKTQSLLFALSIHDINRIASHADFHNRSIISFYPDFKKVILREAYKDSCNKSFLFNVVKCGITQNDCEKYFKVKKTKVSLIRKNIGQQALGLRTLIGVPSDTLKSIRSIYERDFGLYLEETERIYNVAIMLKLNFSQIANALTQYDEFYNYLTSYGCSREFSYLFFGVPERISRNFPTNDEIIHKDNNKDAYSIFLTLKSTINQTKTDKENTINLKKVIGELCSNYSMRIDTLFIFISNKLTHEEQVCLKLIFKKLAIIYQK